MAPRVNRCGRLAGNDPVTQDVEDPDARDTVLTGLEPQTEYLFTVSALGADGAGPTGHTTETPTAWQAPTAPRSLLAHQSGDNEVLVSFTEPADPGSSPVQGYILLLASSTTADIELNVEATSTTTEVTLSGVPAGSYQLSVVAMNAEDDSDPAVTTVTVSAPDAPFVGTPVVGAPVSQPVTTGTTTGTPIISTTRVTSTTSAPGALAHTGGEGGPLALLGALLIGFGALALRATRQVKITRA